MLAAAGLENSLILEAIAWPTLWFFPVLVVSVRQSNECSDLSLRLALTVAQAVCSTGIFDFHKATTKQLFQQTTLGRYYWAARWR